MSQEGILSFNSSSTFIQTITGNVGGPVHPDAAGNFNLVANTTMGITTVGTPGLNQINILGIQADTTQIGVAAMATAAQALAGTDTTTIINPSTLFTRVVTFSYKALTQLDSPYTALTTDYYLSCNVALGTITIKLPNAPSTGRVFIVKDSSGNAGVNNITVTTVAGLINIDGGTSYSVNSSYQSIQLLFDGTNYQVF